MPQVFLSGGLGNQLFQLAAALANSKGPIILNGTLGYPRSNERDVPDILDFELPSRVKVLNCRTCPAGIRDTSDLLLRASSSLKLKPKNVSRRIIISAGSVILSLYLREIKKVRLSHGTGHLEFSPLDKKSVLFGFFHTYIFPEKLYETVDDLRNLKLVKTSPELKKIVNSLKSQKILVVHIRLGDYVNEPKLGILPPSYFANAIQKACQEAEYDEIWIFSASPDAAVNYVPRIFHKKIRMMEGVLKTPAETLELMRYGDGFVISNSTFGWWGAFLSYKKVSNVYVPEPWFKSAANPIKMIPAGWKKINW